ncbi:hypothetical protein [Clostridium sp.]|uniref:hypothetical protein n=1 Tax=Clostridium sp. TaxID=1506 RepID=UPI001B6BB6D1|nr:hypothetical protein [Clostridium sp.]MBP3915034.1 hypothetical protein [Clostridium sp.]
MSKSHENVEVLSGQMSLNIDTAQPSDSELPESEYAKLAREGKEARDSRESELVFQIVESTFKDLSTEFKEIFYDVYKTDDQAIKAFIKDYVIKTCPGLNEVYYDENKSLSLLLREQTYKLQNSIEIQKKRWYKKGKEAIEKKNDFLKRSYEIKYKKMYNITFEEFIPKADELLESWYKTNYASGDNNSLIHMVNYPFFDSFVDLRSKKSALKYDLSLVALYACGIAINSDFIIYRQLDYFTKYNIFTKSSKKKLDVRKFCDNNKNIIISNERHKSGNTIIDQQINVTSLIENNVLPESQKEFLLNAAKNFELYKDNKDWFEVVKYLMSFLRDYDETDQELFSYILSQISQSFYIDRKISFTEKDALISLGKDHKSGNNKKWLRARTQKLRWKSLKIMDAATNRVTDSCATVFQDVQLSYGVDNNKLKKYKVITVVASDELYKRILKEDTINVYRNDFVSVRESDKPYATFLLYHLQLLRINMHIINKSSTKLPTSFFESKIDLSNMDKIDAIEEIRGCLKIYEEKKIFIKSFSYDDKYDIWNITFFPFKKHDVNMLINSKKDYKKLLMDCEPQLLPSLMS